MAFISLIAMVVVFIFLVSLSSRMGRLEKRLKEKGVPDVQPNPSLNNAQPEETFESQTEPQQIFQTNEPAENTPAYAAVQKTESEFISMQSSPAAFDRFFVWLKEDWLMKLGALLLIIGFGWFTSYAFSNDWVGPLGRIGLGVLLGVLFMAFGWWRIKKYLGQGGVFIVLGSTTVLLTLFAARTVYDLFTPAFVLSVMFLSAGFVAFASVRYKSRALAVSSLVMAGIVPLFVHSPSVNYVGLFSYLFIVTLGTVWVVFLTKYRELSFIALLMVGFYSLPHLISQTMVDKEILLLFACAFTIVFFVTNTIGILRLKVEESFSDFLTVAGSGLFLLAWIVVAAPEQWKVLMLLISAAVFLGGGLWLYQKTKRQGVLFVYTAIATMLLVVATSVQFDGASLNIAYIIESAIIPLALYSITKNGRAARLSALLTVGPIFLSLPSIMSPAWERSILNQDFFVLLILSLAFFVLGEFFLYGSAQSEDKTLRSYDTLFIIAGEIYAYILVWLSLHAGFHLEFSNAILTTAFAIEFGIIPLIVYGVLRDVTVAYRPVFLLALSVFFSLSSIFSSAWKTSVFNEDFFALLILGLVFLILGGFFSYCTRQSENKNIKKYNATLFIVGSIYIYILLWLALHAGFQNDNFATMIALVVYTIVGLISYFYGLAKEKRNLQIYGGMLISFVVLRLLLIDVWNMDLAGRTATFFLVGALLVSTAFLGRKKKKTLSENASE